MDRILDYSISGKTYKRTITDQNTLSLNPPVLADHWSTINQYENLKQNIRKHYARRQNRRCAYCRVLIAIDGYGHPIEHITCRNRKPSWMFSDYNLVVSCIGCNSSKGTKNVLVNEDTYYGDLEEHCPSNGDEYRIFNPHFEKWSDHFEIEDDFFLRPKPNTNGPYTYETCNMYRYQIILDYREQINLRDKKTHRNITKRIRKEKNEDKLEHLKKAFEAILDMIDNH
ncbi:hypothetical protein ABWH96_11415 [Marivirga tractuosa]|uniref:hypothetical protein n=1 Tax=Marivirga tractuosa TaxID=1006 RepID=UPI0035CF8FD1